MPNKSQSGAEHPNSSGPASAPDDSSGSASKASEAATLPRAHAATPSVTSRAAAATSQLFQSMLHPGGGNTHHAATAQASTGGGSHPGSPPQASTGGPTDRVPSKPQQLLNKFKIGRRGGSMTLNDVQRDGSTLASSPPGSRNSGLVPIQSNTSSEKSHTQQGAQGGPLSLGSSMLGTGPGASTLAQSAPSLAHVQGHAGLANRWVLYSTVLSAPLVPSAPVS